MNQAGYSYKKGEPKATDKAFELNGADARGLIVNAVAHLKLYNGVYRAEFRTNNEDGKVTYIKEGEDSDGIIFCINEASYGSRVDNGNITIEDILEADS